MFHADKARFENEISILKKKYEQGWIMSKENNEKQLSYEDDKYKLLIKNASNIDAVLKKREEMIMAKQQKIIQQLTDDFNRDLKAIEDGKFEEQIKKERDDIYLKTKDLDDQSNQEVLELKMYFDAKFRKLSVETKKSQAMVNMYKDKLRIVQKESGDLTFVVDKYNEDIEKSKIEVKNIIDTVTETKAELEKYKKLNSEKNYIINYKKSYLVIMKKEVIGLRKFAVDLEDIIDPLKSTLKDMKINMDDMKKELVMIKTDCSRLKSNCTAQEDETKMILDELVKSKEYYQTQNKLMDFTVLNIQSIFAANSGNVMKLRDCVKELHHNFVNKGLSVYLNTDLYRKIMFKEKCLARLKVEKIATERKPPSYLKKAKDNRVLVKEINKLKKELAFNKNRFQNLECLIAEKRRNNGPMKD